MDKEAYISTLKNPNSWFDQAFSQKMVADKILNEIIMNREFIVKLKETQDYDEFVGLWANALYHYGIGIENGLKGIIIKNYPEAVNFEVTDDNEQVAEYVKRHVDELENNKSEEEDMGLQMLLLMDNETLTSEQYEKLAKCFDEYFNTSELANLDDGRLKAVVNNDLVEYNKESVDFFKGKSEELLAHFIIHFFGEIEKDESFDVSFSNELSLRLLNSELTLGQKKWLLDTQIIMNDGGDKLELAKQVCYYTKETGVDKDTVVDFVVEAMETYTEEAGWTPFVSGY